MIGVCRDLQSVRSMQDDGPFYYRPLDLEESKPPYLLVRVSDESEAAATALRDIVQQVDPQMATTVTTLASVIERQGEQMKPMMFYAALAGMLAMLLALTELTRSCPSPSASVFVRSASVPPWAPNVTTSSPCFCGRQPCP